MIERTGNADDEKPINRKIKKIMQNHEEANECVNFPEKKTKEKTH
jgi:hypothetical protein